MAKPQQPELARDRQGSQDRDGKELRVDAPHLPEAEEQLGDVPAENQPGHRPEVDQDKPQGPPQ